MTAREILNKGIKTTNLFIGFGIMSFFLGFVLTMTNKIMSVNLSILLMLIGFISIVIGSARVFMGLPCPLCKKRVSILAKNKLSSGFALGISNDRKYCEYCGVDLDSTKNNLV